MASLSPSRKIKQNLEAHAYLMPAVIILTIFWVLPVILSLLVSFTNWHGGDTLSDVKWVGIENYRIAFHDQRFFKTLANTFNYVIWSVPLTIGLALLMALLLNLRIKGVAFFRTAFFLPYVTTWVAISIVWSYFFQQNFGLANYILDDVLGLGALKWLNESRGILEMTGLVDKPLAGLAHLLTLLPKDNHGFAGFLIEMLRSIIQGPSLAMFAVIITSIWRDMGYFIIIFLAGLRNIDKTYYEAAQIDGAGPWRRFWAITFPLLSPVTFFVLIVAMVGAFKVFVPILVMTPDGGPSGSTSTLVYFLYEEGFMSWRLGYASAIAYILFVIILAITLLQDRFLGRKVFYQ